MLMMFKDYGYKLNSYRQCIEKLPIESGEAPPVKGQNKVDFVLNKERALY